MPHQVKVTCPNNNLKERKYAIETLFSFLSIDCDVHFSNSIKNYEIEYNNRKIEILDDFFARFPRALSYLDRKNIPNTTMNFTAIDYSLVLLYGTREFEVNEQGIYCGLDIFASAFFMISRWEEQVITERNSLGRCDEDFLLAVREKFLHRPIVNEYVGFLSEMLKHIGYKYVNLKKRSSEIILSHDVDRMYLSSFSELLHNLSLLVFTHKQYKKARQIFSRYLQYALYGKRPFDSFKELMDYSDDRGFKNTFFFKATMLGEPGATYGIDEQTAVATAQYIQSRGHHIGFHPSENSFNNEPQLKAELGRLQSVAGGSVIGARSHQLLYSEETLAAWDIAGIRYDSGCGFQYYNGFRAGVCYPYKIFNVRQRKELTIVEIPFIVMDSVWLRQGVDPSKFYEEAAELIKTASKYRGTICMNWHSNLINSIELRKLRSTYFMLVDYLRSVK